MRDGTQLVADIYRPRTEGSLPVLLERTPYEKTRTELVASARYFARRGYVVVLQDVRGRGGSGGQWYPLAQESNDGFDSIEWIAAQPWCDGHVGTIGLSYTAANQHALAHARPPHLSAMFVSQGPFNVHSSIRPGGAFELRFLTWLFDMARKSPEARRDTELRATLEGTRVSMADWLRSGTVLPGDSPLRNLPSYERFALDILQHDAYDEYWRRFDANAEAMFDDHADVPIFFLTGWFDSYSQSTTEKYVAFRKHKKGPVRLLVGPWRHGLASLPLPSSGDVQFGPDAALDGYDDLRLRWFDQHLKGLDTAIDDEASVRIFVMGGGTGLRDHDGRLEHGGTWREEHEWPLARAQRIRLYLHGGGTLRPDPPTGAVPPSHYCADPTKPVPTIGPAGASGYDLVPAGGFDQRCRSGVFACTDGLPLGARPDVLVFQTEALSEAVEVTGPLELEVWISSSAVDTDFTAKLIDVYPPTADYPGGYALNLTDGILRTRYRDSRERAALLTPGQVYALRIQLPPTSNQFAAGHRIRLDIASSNFPKFDINPNTGPTSGRRIAPLTAENVVYHDHDHPSALMLPIVR